jgi:hypothetical protein
MYHPSVPAAARLSLAGHDDPAMDRLCPTRAKELLHHAAGNANMQPLSCIMDF